MLLNLDDWQRVLDRPPALPLRQPFVSIDMGFSRSWCSALAIFDTGLVQAFALAPGLPSISECTGKTRSVFLLDTYRMLHESGSLLIATGLRVPPARQLLDEVFRRWGRPAGFNADRFRIADLQDCVRGVSLTVRKTRWSESGEDIRALRKISGDGPLSYFTRFQGFTQRVIGGVDGPAG